MSNKMFARGTSDIMPHPQLVSLELDTLPTFHCANCQGNCFQPAYMIFERPAVLSQNGKAGPHLHNVFVCLRCGAVQGIDEMAKMSAAERDAWLAAEAKAAEEARAGAFDKDGKLV